MNKITKILHYINDTPKCTHRMMVEFICKMNNRPYSSGYYGTVLSNFQYVKKIIRKDQYGYYHLTKYGKDNIDHPYKLTDKEKKRNLYYQIRREMYYDIIDNEKNRKKVMYERLLKTIEKRGHITTIIELKAFLSQFDDWDEIELSIDAEGNDFGKIADGVFKDETNNQYGKVNKWTLFPLLNRYLEVMNK